MSGMPQVNLEHQQPFVAPKRKPRLGFVGVGWIGRNRMEAIAASGVADITAITDTDSKVIEEAILTATGAEGSRSFEELLTFDLDGVVIATPNAYHACQAINAFECGIAVFCQKPLARTGEETRRVIDAARRANRLLGVDFSYRHTEAMRKIRRLIEEGVFGEIYAVDLVFHNAYGPDKNWFYDRSLSGGGCVMDLGIHLVDLALWALGFPEVTSISSKLYAGGRRMAAVTSIEDYAVANIDLATGATVSLACSWRVSAGCDAVISATFYGTRGGASFHNVNGSFYDFVADRCHGTSCSRIAEPPDQWGGRAIVDWAEHLAMDRGFDDSAEHLVKVAEVLDGIYGRYGQ